MRMGWKWLSTGQMLRDSNDPEMNQLLKTGELINDEIICRVFAEAVNHAKENNFPKIIVDGFPRTKEQAEWLAGYIKEIGETIEQVVVLEVPEGEITKRLELRGRMEDTPETVARRMTIYRQKMYPVLGSFASDSVKIIHMDGTGTAGEVHDRLYSEVVGEA